MVNDVILSTRLRYKKFGSVVTTETNILATQHLLTKHSIDYVSPAVNLIDPDELFFGQATQRSGRSFNIDIVDVVTAAKMQVLHQFLKLDIIPDKVFSYKRPNYIEEIASDNINVIKDLRILTLNPCFNPQI